MTLALTAAATLTRERADGLYGVDRVARLIKTYEGIQERADQAEATVARQARVIASLKTALEEASMILADGDYGEDVRRWREARERVDAELKSIDRLEAEAT